MKEIKKHYEKTTLDYQKEDTETKVVKTAFDTKSEIRQYLSIKTEKGSVTESLIVVSYRYRLKGRSS